MASLQEQVPQESSQKQESCHWHHGKTSHAGCGHHTRVRRPWKGLNRLYHVSCRRRRSREWSWKYLSLLKCSGYVVSQVLGWLFRAFPVVIFHVLFVSCETWKNVNTGICHLLGLKGEIFSQSSSDSVLTRPPHPVFLPDLASIGD